MARKIKDTHLFTLPATDSKFAPENRRQLVFQPYIFGGHVSFRECINIMCVYIYIYGCNSKWLTTKQDMILGIQISKPVVEFCAMENKTKINKVDFDTRVSDKKWTVKLLDLRLFSSWTSFFPQVNRSWIDNRGIRQPSTSRRAFLGKNQPKLLLPICSLTFIEAFIETFWTPTESDRIDCVTAWVISRLVVSQSVDGSRPLKQWNNNENNMTVQTPLGRLPKADWQSLYQTQLVSWILEKRATPKNSIEDTGVDIESKKVLQWNCLFDQRIVSWKPFLSSKHFWGSDSFWQSCLVGDFNASEKYLLVKLDHFPNFAGRK